jgi:hypothetical protein
MIFAHKPTVCSISDFPAMKYSNIVFASCLVIIAGLGSQAANAQGSDPYIHSGSIGTSSPTQTPSQYQSYDVRPFAALTVREWIGRKFIFLPVDKAARTYAYGDFHPALAYQKYVGRTATVSEITGQEYGADNDHPSSIHLVMDDNGERVATSCNCPASQLTLSGLGLVSDIDNARTKWLGKTLYLNTKTAAELQAYDASRDESTPVHVKKFSAVRVTAIVAGYSSLSPVRFILRTPEGVEAYLDVNVSNTNAGATSSLFRVEDKFLTDDPHAAHNWPKKVWDAIEESSIFKGMTTEQARMSWGEPNVIGNSTSTAGREESWSYSSGSKLVFTNGILTTVQN